MHLAPGEYPGGEAPGLRSGETKRQSDEVTVLPAGLRRHCSDEDTGSDRARRWRFRSHACSVPRPHSPTGPGKPDFLSSSRNSYRVPTADFGLTFKCASRPCRRLGRWSAGYRHATISHPSSRVRRAKEKEPCHPQSSVGQVTSDVPSGLYWS